MPATVQPVIVTPSIPLLLAFYKALLGAVEISRVPEEGPAFYVGLQIGNAELGVVADGDAHIDAPQRILLNVNVSDLGVGNVAGLLDHVRGPRRPGARPAERNAVGTARGAHPGPGREHDQPHRAHLGRGSGACPLPIRVACRRSTTHLGHFRHIDLVGKLEINRCHVP